MFLVGCRQPAALRGGEDGLFRVDLELVHPSSAEPLLDEELVATVDQWVEAEAIERVPARWENQEPVAWRDSGQRVEVKLWPYNREMLAIDVRFEFFSPTAQSGMESFLARPENLGRLELALGEFELRLRVEP